MANNRSAKSSKKKLDPKAAAKKQKQQVVVILVLILVLAVVMMPGKSSKDKEAKEPALNALATVEPVVASEKESETPLPDPVDVFGIKEIPTIKLQEIVALEPFSGAIEHVEIAAEPESVSAIYKSRKSGTAIVGSDFIRTGQRLPGGRKVIGMSARGVQIGR